VLDVPISNGGKDGFSVVEGELFIGVGDREVTVDGAAEVVLVALVVLVVVKSADDDVEGAIVS